MTTASRPVQNTTVSTTVAREALVRPTHDSAGRGVACVYDRPCCPSASPQPRQR